MSMDVCSGMIVRDGKEGLHETRLQPPLTCVAGSTLTSGDHFDLADHLSSVFPNPSEEHGYCRATLWTSATNAAGDTESL